MRIVENRSNTDFQIKISNQYVTVASLVPWLLSKHLHKYSLYFYYYGEEFERSNGNVSITVWKQKHEYWYEFIERVQRIVMKKLYIISDSILEEIKYIEQ